MNKEKEIETVTLMVRRYYCGVHWTRGEAALSGVQCTAGIRLRAAGQMPARENIVAL